jgi:hypothetical protein
MFTASAQNARSNEPVIGSASGQRVRAGLNFRAIGRKIRNVPPGAQLACASMVSRIECSRFYLIAQEA